MIDLFSLEAMADHTVVTRALLSGDRVARYEGFGKPFYIASRYADVDEVLRNKDVYISGKGHGPNFDEGTGVTSDAPDHAFYRHLVQDTFQTRCHRSTQAQTGADCR